MDPEFISIPYDGVLESMPKGPAVYKIFDRNDQLIVLDKTSNLFDRMSRFFGPRTELVKDLDLREITSRVEYRRTWSPFETAYVLYLERRKHFPKTYRKMRTFRTFGLMKINRKQRFPRIYASRQIKPGVDYFGPFSGHGQFTRLKTVLERTFKLRPCLYNIRGNDPRPDCMYFQMHTCSRPCNNDIDRPLYLADIDSAIKFITGNEEAIAEELLGRISQLAIEERFEEAEMLRRKLDKLRGARQEIKETFTSLWAFNYLVILSSGSTSRVRIAFVRAGNVLALEDYEVAELAVTLPIALEHRFRGPMPRTNHQWQYDEFCLVSTFLVDSLKSVDLIRIEEDYADTTARVEALLRRRKKQTGENPAAVEPPA